MKAKKLAAVALSLCLTVPMFSTIVSAADGSLMFSDPQTKVGEEVSVDLVVRSGNSAVGDADITMSYDTSALQFESGEGVTADSDGKLTYSGSGDGTATELRTTMTLHRMLIQQGMDRQMMVQQRLRQMEVNQLAQLLILR